MKEKIPTSSRLLNNPVFNKGTAFTDAERDALGLRGLLPPHVHTQDEQVMRVIGNIRREKTDLEKYLFLNALQDRNQTLFYRVVMDYLEEMMPIIYTPTVGLVCQEYGHIFRRPKGLFITIKDRGRVHDILSNWPHKEARVIVVTDGERILGLGDLGAAGMGIPIGKLSLYTACAGIHPIHCLPVVIDVGTNNKTLLEDPLYLGLRHERVRGAEYDALIDEFVVAAKKLFPDVLIQFEDFANANAFRLLKTYREKVCMFNDDIQGTAGVALAGLYSALRMTGGKLGDQKILFLGAGEAAIGISNLIVSAMVKEGVSLGDARKCCLFVDSKGLVVQSRNDLNEHKRAVACDVEFIPDLLNAVKALKPTALIGASGQPGVFTKEILELMAQYNDRPVVFALSNPTDKAECTAEEAYHSTEGRAVFASGSPFAAVSYKDQTIVPGQGNNAYIFPGVGLGVVASKAKRVTDEMFLVAARALADSVLDSELKQGSLYPSLRRIRKISEAIAISVAEVAFEQGHASIEKPGDLSALIRSQVYEPVYTSYV